MPAQPFTAADLARSTGWHSLLSGAFDHWADFTGIVALLFILVLVVLFYRRLLRKALRAEQRQRLLLESAPFAVVVTHKQSGRILFANHHAISLLALSPTAYHQQQVPYADPARARKHLLQALANSGHIDQFEGELESHTGRRFPAIASATQIQFDGEDAILGSFQDISRLKEAEAKLRASEARLLAVFQAVPDGVLILDQQGIIRHASTSCLEILDIPEVNALRDRPVLDFLEAADRPVAQHLLREIGSTNTSEAPAFKINRRDGSPVWVEPRAVPMDDPVSGEPAIVLVLRNITRRREAQQALAARAAELQAALNRIANLQNEILRVCAWTKQVDVDGTWIPIDIYLARHLGIKVTHGISAEGLAMLDLPPEDKPPASDTPKP